MSTKTTGAELKAFYIDTAFWPDGAYHDDEEIIVDGVNHTPFQDMLDIPDSSDVRISNGIVLGLPGVDDDNAPSFEAYFKRWRKQQATSFIAVECNKDKFDAVVAAIIAAGGKVK